jgi:hypothetical protein
MKLTDHCQAIKLHAYAILHESYYMILSVCEIVSLIANIYHTTYTDLISVMFMEVDTDVIRDNTVVRCNGIED